VEEGWDGEIVEVGEIPEQDEELVDGMIAPPEDEDEDVELGGDPLPPEDEFTMGDIPG
jgi:hypothetical protein